MVERIKIMKAIIYYRKSTDRDDKQANSLEHQLENCRKTARSNSFEIVKEIGESRSAKLEWTRPWFKELIKLCKTWKIDYVVIDEAKRLSRNNMDSARIIDLFDRWYIKWIYSSGRCYLAEHINDIFLLQLDLSLSKMDNAHRSKDVKEKMRTCIANQKRFLWKVPFGYKNITIKKWHKDIIVNEEEAKVVREIYELRLENKAFSTIAEIIKEKYGASLNLSLRANRMQQLVGKKFYYWVFIWWWEETQWTHTPLISKDMFDRVNKVEKWVYENKATLRKRERKVWKYPLKWLVKDTSWIFLSAYVKKGITYYCNQYRSDVKVSINENKLFDTIGDYIKDNEWTHELLTSIDKDIILDLLRREAQSEWNIIIDIENKIENFRVKKERLLDMKLENVISNEVYLTKNNEIENQIQDLEVQKKSIENDDFEEKAKILFELAGSFYQSYIRANEEEKIQIIKKLMFELFVTNKKELRVEESPLFQSSKMLNCCFGTPNNRWGIVNDWVMWGKSRWTAEIVDDKLVFSGEIVTLWGGFSSLRGTLESGLLSEYSSVQLRAKSDGREYRITLRDNQWGNISRSVKADPFNKESAREMGVILSDWVDGEFKLEIDEVRFCR